MSTKGKTIGPCSSAGLVDGDCLSNMPTATGEQLHIAKILQKPENDRELKHYISQLRELTQCTEDEAVTALYDCGNDLERAVERLLDKFRFGNDNEWQTTVGKRAKTKVRPNTASTSDEPAAAIPSKEVDTAVNRRDEVQSEKQNVMQPHIDNKAKKDRKSKKSLQTKSRGSDTNDPTNNKTSRAPPKVAQMEVNERITKERFNNEAHGWDPYTAYGEWTGEPIEVINSDVNIAKGLEDGVVLDLLVESESESASTREGIVTPDHRIHEPSTSGDSSDAPTGLFVITARSKPPPPAFSNRPNIGLYLATDVLPNINSNLRYVFGGDWTRQLLPGSGTNTLTSLQTPPATDASDRLTSPRSSSSTGLSKSNAKAGSIDSSTVHADKVKNAQPRFTENVCVNSTSLKNSSLFQSTQKSLPTSALLTEDSPKPSAFNETAYKDYIIDGISSNSTKLPAEQVSTGETYVQRPNQPDSQTAGSSFGHQPAASVSMPTQKSAVSHASVTAQTTTASHTQQSNAISHPVPHFVGQFTPSPYMFNVPGNSGNPAAMFELDHLQLLQHRMLYDMHLQQQAATTVQNVLPPTETSGKNSGQGVPAPFTHVTAASTTIRPDIISSAVGQATQLMQAGHPYFHYPRFVLMNGYQNTYFNQQQASQESTASGNTTSQLSNAPVIHGALPVTQSDGQNPPYSNMKAPHPYTDLSDIKYGDPSKQVGFKSGSGQQHQPYFPFSSQGTTEAVKPMPPTTLNQATASGAAASSAGYPTTGSAIHYSQQQQSQQFYPSVGTSPYFTAAAVAAAAVAAASAQQQQQQHVIGGPGNQPSVSSGTSSGPGPGQMTHLHPQAGAPAMVYPGTGLHAHHSGQQRSAIPH